MIDREKVIKGLECCTTMDEQGWPSCEKCPYDVNGTCPDLDALHRDALMLLKAQEPRVMTLEEALSSDECWIEGRNGACGYGDALLTNDAERVDFYRPHRIDTLEFYAYGMEWRCWSYKPTDAQREAVKWG